MLHNRSPHSASRHFINLPRLPYLINADQFINAPPPRSPYAHGTRDVVCGGSGGDSSSPYADGSSDMDSSLPPINVFIDGERRSPFADRSVNEAPPNVGGIFEDDRRNITGVINNVPPITAAVIEHALELISSNPLRKMMRLKGWTPVQVAAMKEQDNSEEVYNFVVNLVELPFCFNRFQKSFTDCQCLAAVDRVLLPSISDMLSKFLFYN